MCKHFIEHFSLSIIFVIFIYSSIIQAQVDTLWTKTFGRNGYDCGYSVQQTSREGYILTGTTTSFGAGNYDLWLIKTDDSGDTLWTKTFGGSKEDQGFSIQKTSDTGYIITGYTKSFGMGAQDVWVIKTDAMGDTLWTKTFGKNGDDYGNSIYQTSDEGYILTGTTTSYGAGNYDLWLIKTNTLGDTLWTKTFGGSGEDRGYSVQQTSDGGFIITGSTASYGAGNLDVWLIKTDTAGDIEWTKTFGGIYSDLGRSVQQTMDEGYIITGYTSSFGAGGNDVWVIKTDADGNGLWAKTFGGSQPDNGSSIQQTSDEGYILTASTYSFGTGNRDTWLIKTDINGDTLWTKTFGGGGEDMTGSVQRTLDQGYIIIGVTNSFGTSGADVWLIKTTFDATSIEKTNITTPSDYTLSQNFPNPFNPKTTFKFSIPKSVQATISIYTISGQIIESKTMNLNTGSYSYEFDGTKYSTGIYFYKISTSSGFMAEKKMVLLK